MSVPHFKCPTREIFEYSIGGIERKTVVEKLEKIEKLESQKVVTNLFRAVDYFILKFVYWCDETYIEFRIYRQRLRVKILGSLPSVFARPLSSLVDRISEIRLAVIKYGSTPYRWRDRSHSQAGFNREQDLALEERGDVPGWVLVVLMTTGLVTAIWTIAAPRLSTILRNSLDSMNGIR